MGTVQMDLKDYDRLRAKSQALEGLAVLIAKAANKSSVSSYICLDMDEIESVSETTGVWFKWSGPDGAPVVETDTEEAI